MLDHETLQKCKQDYDRFLPLYQTMQGYYDGKTDAMANYQEITERANNKVNCNSIQKFINEEASYVCGNKITFLSHPGNEQEVEDIRISLKHWSLKHNRELCILSDENGHDCVTQLFPSSTTADKIKAWADKFNADTAAQQAAAKEAANKPTTEQQLAAMTLQQAQQTVTITALQQINAALMLKIARGK